MYVNARFEDRKAGIAHYTYGTCRNNCLKELRTKRTNDVTVDEYSIFFQEAEQDLDTRPKKCSFFGACLGVS